MSRSVPSRQISPLSLCKCRLTAPKIAKIGNFWYKFAPKGYISLSDFSKIWHGEGFPRFAPSRQILPFWLSKCGLMAQKSAKFLICGDRSLLLVFRWILLNRVLLRLAISLTICAARVSASSTRPARRRRFYRRSFALIAGVI